MFRKTRCIVLIVRMASGMILIAVWIIRSPYQNTGRGFSFQIYGTRNFVLVANVPHWHASTAVLHFALLSPNLLKR